MLGEELCKFMILGFMRSYFGGVYMLFAIWGNMRIYSIVLNSPDTVVQELFTPYF